MNDKIICKTRTGKKVHRGSAGSSVTDCGHWQKVQNQVYRLDLSPAELADMNKMGSLVLCEHCFPNGYTDAALAVAKPAATTADVRSMDFRTLLDSGLTEETTGLGQQARFQAAYLFRTMSVQERFSYLSVEFPPRLAQVYRKVMEAGS